MALGYGNFTTAVQYDIYAMAEKFVASGFPWDVSEFQDSQFSLDFSFFESPRISNSPNLSLLPLLAYHKICNDHYRNEKWQPFEPWTCNIDYIEPLGDMNFNNRVAQSDFTSVRNSIIDLENSNLPIDYFTSVLPRAQYGDESAVSVGLDRTTSTLWLNDTADATKGFLFNGSSFTPGDDLQKVNQDPVHSSNGSYAAPVS